MPKMHETTPSLNRLRAAAGLLPQIEASLRDGKISPEKAALSAEFCLWALDTSGEAEGGEDMARALREGLGRLRSATEIGT